MDICPEVLDASLLTSATSSAFGIPSPEPTSNVHSMDYNSVDPEFAAALNSLELVPEKDIQSNKQGVCPATLVVLQLRAQAVSSPFA